MSADITVPVVGAVAWYHRGMVNFDEQDALKLLDDGKGAPINLYIGAAPAPREWISVLDRLPELGDYSVLAFWAGNGCHDMVHVEEYFAPITNGLDADGKQLMTKWYLSSGITHWMPFPALPGSTS